MSLPLLLADTSHTELGCKGEARTEHGIEGELWRVLRTDGPDADA